MNTNKITFFWFVWMTFFCLIGCASKPYETVGLRIFDENQRFYNDKVTIDLIGLSDNKVIAANLRPGANWSPLEIYRLPKDEPILLRLQYQGAQPSERFIKTKRLEQVIDMANNYDIHIQWLPFMEQPSQSDEENPDFDWTPHWSREPELSISAGHPGIF